MAGQILKALIAFTLIGNALLLRAAEPEDPKQSGPVALVIQYRCLPAQRVAFRQRLEAGLPRFAQWQSDKMLSDYHVLFSRYVDTNTWDALILLTFRSYSDAAHWRRIEETMPAGLSPDTLAVTVSIESYPADRMRQSSKGERATHPVYLVVPYTFSVANAAYLQYFDTYVNPQFTGWQKEGILAGYELYMQRYTAARPWDTLILLQYKDDESFGQRERVVAKVRAQLQNDPVWKAASDNKQSVRVEKEAVIADELFPRH